MSENKVIFTWLKNGIISLMFIYVVFIINISCYKSMDIALKNAGLVTIFLCIYAILYRFLKNGDIFLEILLISITLFSLKVAANYLIFHKSHFEFGGVEALVISIARFSQWYKEKEENRKNLRYWKVISLVLFFATFIIADFYIQYLQYQKK